MLKRVALAVLLIALVFPAAAQDNFACFLLAQLYEGNALCDTIADNAVTELTAEVDVARFFADYNTARAGFDSHVWPYQAATIADAADMQQALADWYDFLVTDRIDLKVIRDRRDKLLFALQGAAALDKGIRDQLASVVDLDQQNSRSTEWRSLAIDIEVLLTQLETAQIYTVTDVDEDGLADHLTLTGHFTLDQSDGADCNFSTASFSSGRFTFEFDFIDGTLHGEIDGGTTGSRSTLQCGTNTGTMSYYIAYAMDFDATVAVDPANPALVPVNFSGSLAGENSWAWSICEDSLGNEFDCPDGGDVDFTLPMTWNGTLDRTTLIGGGTLRVDTGLPTQGAWAFGAD